MKRRDSLKALSLSSLGLAVVPASEMAAPPDQPIKIPNGRTKEEAIRDAKLMAEKFFTPHELKTVTVLSDIIIPADAKSGSASQAGVPAFIEFMMKDQPNQQVPMRGGLRWMDSTSLKLFGKRFVEATKEQQIQLVDEIAYPSKAKPEYSQGVAFFNRIRGLVATGFYTSKMGIQDLGYVGNTPNNWEGVPEDVLKQYGLSYDS
jgi:gluconate 2-dehydrogenase gamma chain